MARLIDADAMEKTILDFWGCDPAYCMDLNGWDPARADVCTLERLKNAPTVDAVPVVRCKDCRHRDPEDHKCDCGEMERQGCSFPVDDDYFCKYGERKGGDERCVIMRNW